MTRTAPASIVWTVVLVAGASAALVGILLFMARIHHDPLWQSSRDAGATMPPAVHRRPAPPANAAAAVVPDAPVASAAPVADASAGVAVADADPVALATAVIQLRSRRLDIPVSGVDRQALTPSFTQARGERTHEALDIMAASGTPVIAVEDGTVAKLFTSVAGGLTIYQFDPSGTVAYYYAHLQRYADGLADGDAIRRGQVIGYVGSTGNADPSAPHLHFAIFLLGPERRWWEGAAIDPYAVLR